MPDETSPPVVPPVAPKVPVKTPAQVKAEEVAAKLAEQAKANLEASEVYKKAVGGKFTNGKRLAEVRDYVPSRLTKYAKDKPAEARQCFLVNYGHPNVSHFVPCFEFMAEYKPFVEGQEIPVSIETSLPK